MPTPVLTVLDSRQNARWKLVSLLSNLSRPTYLQTIISGIVSGYGLTSIDAASFGFGAFADGLADCSVSAGSGVISSASKQFPASLVGYTVDMAGAGAAGGTLTGVVQAVAGDGGSITLDTITASTSVTASATSAGGLLVWYKPATLETPANPNQSPTGNNLLPLGITAAQVAALVPPFNVNDLVGVVGFLGSANAWSREQAIATTDGTFNGRALDVNMGTTTGADPVLAALRYAGNSVLEIRPGRADNLNFYGATWNTEAVITASAAQAVRGEHRRMRIKVPTGQTNSGELIGTFEEVVRNNQYTGDAGTLASLRGRNMSFGHDNLDGSAPTTTEAHGFYAKLKSLSGTIGNGYCFRAFHEFGAGTLTQGWGFYCDSPTLMNCFEGKTAFGGHGAPAESIDLQDGFLRLLGTAASTIKLANAVTPGAGAMNLTGYGPAGLISANPQAFMKIMYSGHEAVIPLWYLT